MEIGGSFLKKKLLLHFTTSFFSDITEDDLNTSLPYDNTWDVGELKGKELKQLFEYNTIRKNGDKTVLRILQVSGEKCCLK